MTHSLKNKYKTGGTIKIKDVKMNVKCVNLIWHQQTYHIKYVFKTIQKENTDDEANKRTTLDNSL